MRWLQPVAKIQLHLFQRYTLVSETLFGPRGTNEKDHSNVGGKSRARRHLTVEEGEEYIDSGRYRIRIVK